MASLLFVGTHGSDDPTMAALPFVSANGAIEAEHEAQVALVGDAAVVMSSIVAKNVSPVGWRPLEELLATAIENGVPIHV